MLNLRRLEVLMEVVAQGSFSEAASSLHLSQSAVSQQVATLEREIGQPLLERTPAGPKLTAAGEVLSGHAESVLARVRRAREELDQIAGLERGRVRVASFSSASATIVTAAVSSFRGEHPGVDLTLAEAEPDTALPALRRAEHDVVLSFDFEGLPRDLEGDLHATTILTEPMRVALPPGHRLAGRAEIDVSELADEEWLCGVSESCRANVFSICRDSGFEPRVSFENDDYDVLQGLVAAGLGVTLLPELALAPPHPDVVLVDVAGSPPLRRVHAVRRAGATDAATTAMIEALSASAASFKERVTAALAA